MQFDGKEKAAILQAASYLSLLELVPKHHGIYFKALGHVDDSLIGASTETKVHISFILVELTVYKNVSESYDPARHVPFSYLAGQDVLLIVIAGIEPDSFRDTSL